MTKGRDELAEGRLLAKRYAEHAIARIQDELEGMIKIASHMREAFWNEIHDGVGYTKAGVNEKIVKKGKELASMMESLVNAKIRWDKAQKGLADQMTPEEERSWCMDYVKSMTVEDRSQWVKRLKAWQNERKEINADPDPAE